MEPSHTTQVQQLFVRHQAKVRAMAIALTGDYATADEVVQETFLTVTAKASDFVLGSNFLAWTSAIVRYKVLHVRPRMPQLSSDVVDSLVAAAPLDQLDQDDRLPLLMQCVESLPEKARELVRLRYFAEHGPAEIAGLLDRSVVGVNAALVKTRELLRRCVAAKLAGHA